VRELFIRRHAIKYLALIPVWANSHQATGALLCNALGKCVFGRELSELTYSKLAAREAGWLRRGLWAVRCEGQAGHGPRARSAGEGSCPRGAPGPAELTCAGLPGRGGPPARHGPTGDARLVSGRKRVCVVSCYPGTRKAVLIAVLAKQLGPVLDVKCCVLIFLFGQKPKDFLDSAGGKQMEVQLQAAFTPGRFPILKGCRVGRLVLGNPRPLPRPSTRATQRAPEKGFAVTGEWRSVGKLLNLLTP